MLKKFKSLFLVDKRKNLFLENRKRFDDLHGNERSMSLGTIYKRLIEDSNAVDDEEIIDSYQKYSDTIQSNTFAASELELVTISVLCYFKPQLTERLIRRGLLYIVWSIGDNINSSDVNSFVEQRILADDVEPYGGIPPEPGIKWLKSILPTQSEVVQKTLKDVIEKNRLELENL